MNKSTHHLLPSLFVKVILWEMWTVTKLTSLNIIKRTVPPSWLSFISSFISLIFLISNKKVNSPLALLYCCQGSSLPFLSTLTCFTAGHIWCVCLWICVCLFVHVWYMCVWRQSSNPVPVTPQQLMSNAEPLLVSGVCMHVYDFVCIVSKCACPVHCGIAISNYPGRHQANTYFSTLIVEATLRATHTHTYTVICGHTWHPLSDNRTDNSHNSHSENTKELGYTVSRTPYMCEHSHVKHKVIHAPMS